MWPPKDIAPDCSMWIDIGDRTTHIKNSCGQVIGFFDKSGNGEHLWLEDGTGTFVDDGMHDPHIQFDGTLILRRPK